MCMKFKKMLCVVVVAVIGVFVVGCSEEREKKSVINQFTADFEAEYKDMTVRGDILTSVHGYTKINITYPETVEGLNVAYKKGEMEIGMKSLLSTADEAYLPQESFPSVLHSVVISLSEITAESAESEEGFTTYTTQLPQGSCVMKFDEYGFLTLAEIEDQDVVLKFFNHMAT